MRKLYIKTFGCQMNEYDSAKMADVLKASHGLELTSIPEQADMLLLNTCSIREKAEEKVYCHLGVWREWKLARPELFRLIGDSKPGDLLLIEQVDRLSRLTEADWKMLRAELDAKQIRVVALDLPTSHMLAASADDFTGRVLSAVNRMMLDVLAAVARKDYVDRRRRQAQGQAKAKAEGKYRGRPEDIARNAGIASMLRSGDSWTAIERAFGCSRATIAKVAKRIAA